MKKYSFKENYYIEGLKETKSLISAKSYKVSIMRNGELLNTLLKDVYENIFRNLKIREQKEILDSIQKKTQSKSTLKLTLGEYIFLYRDSDFFKIIEKELGFELTSFNIEDMKKVLEIRNNCTHEEYMSNEKEANEVSEILKNMIKELTGISFEEKINNLNMESTQINTEKVNKKQLREKLESGLKNLRISLASESPIVNDSYYEREDGSSCSYNYRLDLYGLRLSDNNEIVVLAGFDKDSDIPDCAIDGVWDEICIELMDILNKLIDIEEISIRIQFFNDMLSYPHGDYFSDETNNLFNKKEWEFQKRIKEIRDKK